MVILLLNGPLQGTAHEVAGGFLVPDKLGLPDGQVLHWYVVSGDKETATFERTEPKK
jgi:hypothetical protein